jgi:hypothetical protein
VTLVAGVFGKCVERGAEQVSELRAVDEDIRFMLPKEIRDARAAVG